MLEIGTIKRARDIGRLGPKPWMWTACETCHTPRWVLLRNGKPENKLCANCRNKTNKLLPHPSGKLHPRWKGGRSITKAGYVQITLPADSPFASMRDKDGCVYEHRLVMAKHLGRALTREEVVHHVNGNKGFNRIRNLELFTKSGHSKHHFASVTQLQKEVRRLRSLLRKASGS